MSDPISQCDYARARHEQYAFWAQLWRILVYVLGAALALLLVTTVLLGVFENWAPAAVTTAGSVASGLGTAWLVKRRDTAVADEKDAYDKVVAACPDTAAADELRARLKVG